MDRMVLDKEIELIVMELIGSGVTKLHGILRHLPMYQGDLIVVEFDEVDGHSISYFNPASIYLVNLSQDFNKEE